MLFANPIRTLLLALLAGLAFPSIRYLWRASVDGWERRKPFGRHRPPDWRTPWGMPRAIVTLSVLGGLAAFLFTPFADEIGAEPILYPVLTAACGALILTMVVRGLASGSIRPLSEQVFNRYQRDRHPMRFWASATWNSLVGGLVFAIGTMMVLSAPHDGRVARCLDHAERPRDSIAACGQLLAGKRGSVVQRAEWFDARGIALHRLHAIRPAMADYRRAIRLDPRQSHTHYNLALLQIDTGDLGGALYELDIAARLDPDHLDTRLRRAELYLHTARPQQAIDDLTDIHRRRPIEPIPIAMRGLIFAGQGKEAHARADFAAARAIEPGNPIAIKGDALLAMNAYDWPAAARHLTAALDRYPGDRWLLASRAAVYRHLDDVAGKPRDLAAIAAKAR